MPGGRPTKYTKTMVKKLIKYFSVEPYREVEVKHFDQKTGKEWSTCEERANDTPTFGGFCASIDIHKDTMYEWRDKHKEFSDALKKAQSLMEQFLVINGNKGLIQQPFAIFTAKNVLKWADKQDLDIKSGGKALSVAGFEVVAPNKDANNNPTTKTNY